MKVTLSAAMRARDVSRPRAEDEEAARTADAAPPPGRTDRAEGRDRNGPAKGAGGRRRKRR